MFVINSNFYNCLEQVVFIGKIKNPNVAQDKKSYSKIDKPLHIYNRFGSSKIQSFKCSMYVSKSLSPLPERFTTIT